MHLVGLFCIFPSLGWLSDVWVAELLHQHFKISRSSLKNTKLIYKTSIRKSDDQHGTYLGQYVILTRYDTNDIPSLLLLLETFIKNLAQGLKMLNPSATGSKGRKGNKGEVVLYTSCSIPIHFREFIIFWYTQIFWNGFWICQSQADGWQTSGVKI